MRDSMTKQSEVLEKYFFIKLRTSNTNRNIHT